jgi:hypothetical protein
MGDIVVVKFEANHAQTDISFFGSDLFMEAYGPDKSTGEAGVDF